MLPPNCAVRTPPLITVMLSIEPSIPSPNVRTSMSPPVLVVCTAADETKFPIVPAWTVMSALSLLDALLIPASVTGPMTLPSTPLPITIGPAASLAFEIRPPAVNPPAISPLPSGAIVIDPPTSVAELVMAPVTTIPLMLALFEVVITRGAVTVAPQLMSPIVIVEPNPAPHASMIKAADVPVFVILLIATGPLLSTLISTPPASVRTTVPKSMLAMFPPAAIPTSPAPALVIPPTLIGPMLARMTTSMPPAPPINSPVVTKPPRLSPYTCV